MVGSPGTCIAQAAAAVTAKEIAASTRTATRQPKDVMSAVMTRLR